LSVGHALFSESLANLGAAVCTPSGVSTSATASAVSSTTTTTTKHCP
jgi:hypothetical protein